MSQTWFDFVYTLKVEPSGFADELDMEYKRNQRAKDAPSFRA